MCSLGMSVIGYKAETMGVVEQLPVNNIIFKSTQYTCFVIMDQLYYLHLVKVIHYINYQQGTKAQSLAEVLVFSCPLFPPGLITRHIFLLPFK